uniref:Acyl-CoA synthetases (AMP-forming)/AMP-acid ligases II n=1 Tax=uncultured myxobacterium HF0200_05J13 TaxID=723557 RepID=E7C3M5_9BACT|nr:acyl-CoA synthetases (AMP-forming)/AMP-acid ligases II [uncultured myxobacterium HF0200_05J13]
MKIPHPLWSTVRARPDHLALVCGDVQLSYLELVEKVSTRAGGLAELGVKKGDRVALLGGFDADWVIAFHAIGWLGAVVVPLAPRLSAEALREQGLTAQVQFLLVGEGFRRLGSALGCRTFEIAGVGPECEPALWDDADVRAVVMTSGTTATPKAVTLSTTQWLYSAMGSSIRLGHHLDDSWLAALPLHHVGGLSILVRAAWLGTTVELAWPFRPAQVVAHLRSGRVTQISLVPEMLSRLLDEEGGADVLSTLRVILLGGDACPRALRQRADALELPVALTWGMSEAASQITTRVPGDLDGRSDVGAPLPFVRVDVGSVDGRLLVRGPTVGGDVLVTSDVGTLDTLGRVSILGRADDIFISGGENVAPARVEMALREHRAVTDAAVVDVPCARWGARPLAFIVAEEGVDGAELRSFLSERLERFELPDRMLACQRLPARGIGKLDRKVLRDLGRGLALGAEVEILNRAQELLGDVARLEGLEVDDGVDELASTAKLSVIAGDAIAKGDGSLANGGHSELHSEPLTESHGLGVVGFGVNQGHSPAPTLEDVGQATSSGHQEFLESGVTILVNTTEEGNASSVDLVESDSNHVFKSHRCSHEESEG